jgi:hypothetical protein
MGKDPSQIRAEVERTRERVGEEVDALSYKTDVGARAEDFVEEKKEAVKSAVGGAKDAVVGTASKAVPSKQGMLRLRDTAERNPLGLAVGGVAAGFLLGLLAPGTRIEDERMGELSDRFVDSAKDVAGEAVERGKHVAEQTFEAAERTAVETGREESRELASEVQARTGHEAQRLS